MTGFVDDIAEQSIDHGIGFFEEPRAYLCAVIRIAGDKLAARKGHDDASAIHASLARKHAEEATRAPGGRNRK